MAYQFSGRAGFYCPSSLSSFKLFLLYGSLHIKYLKIVWSLCLYTNVPHTGNKRNKFKQKQKINEIQTKDTSWQTNKNTTTAAKIKTTIQGKSKSWRKITIKQYAHDTWPYICKIIFQCALVLFDILSQALSFMLTHQSVTCSKSPTKLIDLHLPVHMAAVCIDMLSVCPGPAWA